MDVVMKLTPESKEQLNEQVRNVLINLDKSSFGRYYSRYYNCNQRHGFEELGYDLLLKYSEYSTKVIDKIILKITALFNQTISKEKCSESNFISEHKSDLETAVLSLNTIKSIYDKNEELITLREENEALRTSQKALKEELNKLKQERLGTDTYHFCTYT